MTIDALPAFVDLEPDSVQKFSSQPAPSIVEFSVFSPIRKGEKNFNIFLKSLHNPKRNIVDDQRKKIYTFPEGWQKFMEWVGKKKVILLSYNLNPTPKTPAEGEDQLPGDWAKILAECKRYKIDPPDFYLFDVLKLVELFNLRRKPNLQAMRVFFGLPYEGAHHAAADVKTLYKVFLKLCGSAPLDQVFQLMAQPGDRVRAVADFIKSCQPVKAIFFDLQSEGSQIKRLEAYAPSFKSSTTFSSEEPVENMFRNFKSFLRSYNPLAKVLLISFQVFGGKQPLLDSQMDILGKKCGEWKYFDLGWLHTTLYKREIKDEQRFLEAYPLLADEDLTFSQKMHKIFEAMAGKTPLKELYEAMLHPSHPIKSAADLIKSANELIGKTAYFQGKGAALEKPLALQRPFSPVFFHFNQKTTSKKATLDLIQGVILGEKTERFQGDGLAFKKWILEINLSQTVLCSYNIYGENLKTLRKQTKGLPFTWKFFDLSYLINTLYYQVRKPEIVSKKEQASLNALLAKRKKDSEKSEYNKYLEYHISKSALTLEELYSHYHVPHKQGEVQLGEAEKMGLLFQKMTEMLQGEQVQQALVDPHPIKTLATLIKTHRASVSVFWDTETTGLFTDDEAEVERLRDGQAYTPRIVEIGASKVMQDGQKTYFNCLIDPECPIPKAATDVHHITDAMVKGKPTFKSSWQGFMDWIRHGIPESAEIKFFAHNQEGYDRVIAYLACRYHQMPSAFPLTATFFDTVKFARSLHALTEEDKANEEPAFKNTLENIARVYQITNEDPHRAIGDVKTTMKFFEMATHTLSKEELKYYLEGKDSEKQLATHIRAEITQKKRKAEEPLVSEKPVKRPRLIQPATEEGGGFSMRLRSGKRVICE